MNIQFGDMEFEAHDVKASWITAHDYTNNIQEIGKLGEVSVEVCFTDFAPDFSIVEPVVLSVNGIGIGELSNVKVDGDEITADFFEYKREE